MAISTGEEVPSAMYAVTPRLGTNIDWSEMELLTGQLVGGTIVVFQRVVRRCTWQPRHI